MLTVIDARLMSYEEASNTGCSTSANSCPLWASNQDYWLGSARNNGGADVASMRFINNSYSCLDYRSYTGLLGVRPIVVLKKTAIYVPSDEEYYYDNH